MSYLNFAFSLDQFNEVFILYRSNQVLLVFKYTRKSGIVKQ